MRKNKNQPNKLIILIILLLLIIAGLFYLMHRSARQVNQSYPVNETATIAPATKLYKSLSSLGGTKVDANSVVKVDRYYLVKANKQQQTFARVQVNGKTYYVLAKDLQISLDNDVNKYVAQLGYPHVKISQQINDKFIKRGYASSTGMPQGVVIHDTGTEYSTLSGEARYMAQNYKTDQVFVHTFIDAQEIRNIADTKYMADGAGPKANPYYVQFEMPHEYSAGAFAKQVANAAYYTAYILKKNNLPVIKGAKDGTGTVWTHDMVTRYLGGADHQDPTAYWNKTANKYFGTTYDVNDFIQLVQVYYNHM